MSDNFVRRLVELTREQHIEPAVTAARNAAAVATKAVADDLAKQSPFVFKQTAAAAVWTIAHGKGRYVVVTVLDSAGYVLSSDVRDSSGAVLTMTVQQTDVNTVVVTHAAARSGVVICS